MKKTSRRRFIWLANTGVIALILLVWNKLTLNYIHTLEQKDLILPYNKNQVVSFFENYILIQKKKGLTVLSSHCTHLGCKIKTYENDRLICPCHGSEYDLNGKVIKGPAYKKLQQFSARISADGKNIEILC